MSPDRRLTLRSSAEVDITSEDGVTLGESLAKIYNKVVVARDSVRSSSVMADSVISGLLFQGADVMDLGVMNAPATAMYASSADCAVYVSGREGSVSGYYLLNKNGSPFDEAQIEEISAQDEPIRPSHEALGTYRKREGVAERYTRMISSKLTEPTKCSVVVDCMCGTASDILPIILNRIGADVLVVNAQNDADHLPSSSAEAGTLDELTRLVEINSGGIGIRINVSGTAIDVVDEHGCVLSDDEVAAILALYTRPESIVITADRTSLISDVTAEDSEVKISTASGTDKAPAIVRTAPSASAVCAAISSTGMGFYKNLAIFGDGPLISDGIMVAAMLTLIAGSNSLHQLVESFPKYYSDASVSDLALGADAFPQSFEKASESMADKRTRYGMMYRFDLDDGWFTVSYRPVSAAEGRMEIKAESKDRAYLVGLMEMANGIADEMVAQIDS